MVEIIAAAAGKSDCKTSLDLIREMVI
jgi:hypothetical protein